MFAATATRGALPLKSRLLSVATVAAFAALCFVPRTAVALSCVWKITDSNGGSLYLGGSVHALQSSDYPLPAAYNRALNASSQLVFEDDPKASVKATKDLVRTGTYSKGDNLKNHVDPRTYNYIRRFFALVNVSEDIFSKYRPWLINIVLSSPSSEHWQLGVERYLQRRAGGKSVSGLESPKEHNSFFVGLSDRESEALLLILFINAGREGPSGDSMIKAWRRGDADMISTSVRDSFRDFPSLGRRLVDERNRNWLPKIESYLRSGHTHFIVVGAGHMGGPDGLLAMLRALGYKIEQI